MGRQIFNIIFACLIASTFYHDYVVASRLKKKILLKGLVGAGLLVKYLKPKKGILPIPLPMPLPIPIEWEQPPIIVHPKHHHVPIPQPVPMPVHTPVHVPIHHHSKYLVSESYPTPDYASYSSSPVASYGSYGNSYNNYGSSYGGNTYGGNYGGLEESYGGSDGYGASDGYGDGGYGDDSGY